MELASGIYAVTLSEKDPRALMLADPKRFIERFQDALDNATLIRKSEMQKMPTVQAISAAKSGPSNAGVAANANVAQVPTRTLDLVRLSDVIPERISWL